MYRLPDRHRDALREPFGLLFPDLGDASGVLEGRHVYSVGDVVTHNLLQRGVAPDVAIIDGYTQRVPCTRTPIFLAPRLVVKNPPGTITEALIEAIRYAVAHPPVLIFVEGEEDLAVIPLVIEAPSGSAIVYGQPGEGVVVRIVDEAAKGQAHEYFALFQREGN
ncbi:MAG: GTP-dependent dephospho-CoA kinase family protein [Methanomicrobiaceae archaeon]|nr:GTP-dependent dephospho-CoA kinase family protein [Methanomicrobiaceae archaeon]